MTHFIVFMFLNQTMIFSYIGSCYKRGKSEEMGSIIRTIKVALRIPGIFDFQINKHSMLGKPFGPLHLCVRV